MSRIECERWASLSDRRSAGDAVDEAEQAFLGRHAKECAACAAESSYWDHLAQLPGSSERSDETSRMTALLRARLLSESAPPSTGASSSSPAPEPVATRGRFVRRWWAPSLAAAASLAIVGSQLLDQEVPAPPRLVAALQAGAQATVGDRLEVGSVLKAEASPACFVLEPDIRGCLAAFSQLRVLELSNATKLLELERGVLVSSLPTQPVGSRFSIRTKAGTSTAVGTLFAVDAGNDTSGHTRVLRGKVELRLTGGLTQLLHAGQAASHKDGGVRAVAAQERDFDLSLSRVSDLLEVAAPATLMVDGHPSQLVLLDGAELGTPPLSVLVRPGAHQLELRSAGGVTRELLDLKRGERFLRNKGPEPSASPLDAAELPARFNAEGARAATAEPAPSSTQPRSSADQLKAAGKLRAEGKFAQAAKAFAAVQTEHPGSAAAAIGLSSAAELYLTQLGNPAAALAHYDRYLRTGHQGLEREATYGRIQALRALGRRTEEALAVENALQRFPNDPNTASWKARRDLLRAGNQK